MSIRSEWLLEVVDGKCEDNPIETRKELSDMFRGVVIYATVNVSSWNKIRSPVENVRITCTSSNPLIFLYSNSKHRYFPHHEVYDPVLHTPDRHLQHDTLRNL